MIDLTAPSTATLAAPTTAFKPGPAGTEKPADGRHATSPTDECPLSGLMNAVEADPALKPHATVFYTPAGRTLLGQIDKLKSYAELTSAADLHQQVEAHASSLARQAGRGVLMLSGGHHAPSSLMQYHAAVDACKKHGWPLLLEMDAVVFEDLKELAGYLQFIPELRHRLGSHTLQSRAGQEIAWRYVRQSGDRSVLQKFLPEILAFIDMLGSGVQLVHVDKLGLNGGTDAQREEGMVSNTRPVLPDDGKAVLVLGLVHSMPMHERFRAIGVKCREIAVLDESINHAHRLYDEAENDNPVYRVAMVHSHNLHLPVSARAASRTDAYRMPPDLSPFR